MSADSRMRQFGAMRAIGMSDRQAVRMVAAEAATYGVCGIAVGLIGGIPVHRFLFETLITSKWGDSWKFPIVQTGIILAVLVFSHYVICCRSCQKNTENVCNGHDWKSVINCSLPFSAGF